jgi:hypothetical protein
MVTPTSLNGAGCAAPRPIVGADANAKIKVNVVFCTDASLCLHFLTG